jgi:hypothetical protein
MRTIPIPFSALDVEKLSDTELEIAFSQRDGRWSTLSRRLVRELNADRLDLNENWANVDQSWRCPICGRSKAQIARVIPRGILLARLDEHHDHLHDYMSKELRKEFGGDWPKKIPKGTYEVEHLGSRMIERFERLLVCVDCNAADSYAKNHIPGIHRSFTFRPDEIAKFIRTSANRKHVCDVDAATSIWQAGVEDFSHRIAFADTLLDLMRSGRLKQVPNMSRTKGYLNGDYLRLELRNSTAGDLSNVYRSLAEMWQALVARSISRP